MLEATADNMTTSNLSVVVILELAAATLMTLRMSGISERENDFYPLNDPNWLQEDDFIEVECSAELYTEVDKDDILTAIERIDKAIRFGFVDDGLPKRRNGNFEDEYDDDEDLARKIAVHYYENVANKPKTENKKFYKAIGHLFSTTLKMLKSSGLYFSIFIMSRSQAECFSEDMTDEEKERIIRRQVDPNHRNSFFTTIGYEENKADAKIMEKMRENILRKQSVANKNCYKVRPYYKFHLNEILLQRQGNYLQSLPVKKRPRRA